MKRTLIPPNSILISCLITATWLAVPHSNAITIGQGPAIGTDKRGTIWYQEFQDWSSNDVRAVSANDNEYKFNDGYDTSRDLIAFYSHDGGADGNYYFRVDFFDLQYGAELGNVDVYVAIATATNDAGGQVWFPDFTDTQTENPWRVCVAVYDTNNGQVYDKGFNALGTNQFVASQNGGISYWRSDLDSMEFGIKRQVLINAGWDGHSPLYFQVFTTKDGTNSGAGEIPGSDIVDFIAGPGAYVDRTCCSGGTTGYLRGPALPSTNTVRTAKYAAVAHANQSLGTRTQTQAHIYTKRPDLNLYPGFVCALDSHTMLNVPLNMHISGTLLSSFLWAREDPADPNYTYPERDGPTFLNRVKSFIASGTGSLIGGVYAEHILPYFEGQVNQASIGAFNDLAQSIFGLTTNDMKVMHVPERVIDSNTNWPHANPNGPLTGLPFQDILAGGYQATYLDEVSHLHWWFYSDETNFFNNCCPAGNELWAGFGGCNERAYQHKVHKINGVYCFMINDREDQEKFGPNDGGMNNDTRYTLLDKALQANDPDNPSGYAQLTLVFDDWEAYAGNSFASSTPNNNADQWHQTIRWAANHQWIQVVNLKDVLTWAQSDTNWVIDHGNVYDRSSQTYEWLKRASQQDYDHWYYGQNGLEENFSARHPPADPNAGILTAKPYGDMNTTNTLIRDTWDKVRVMPQGNLRRLAEWAYSAMIYETAWHDEDANPDTYHSRNYQVNFDVNDGCTFSQSDTTYAATSGWALRLHGHVRTVGILADAAQWVQDINNDVQGPTTVALAKNVDDDLWSSYILKNNKVYLCFKRWGGRLIYAFVYDPVAQDAVQVIGQPAANPAQESDEEDADNNRCSAFKDRWSTLATTNYVDMDYATDSITGEQATIGSNFVHFVSYDGKIRKCITLPSGRDVVQAQYTLGSGVGTLYVRHGFGPNQLDLLHHGDGNLIVQSDNTYYGLSNAVGGAAYAVCDVNCQRTTTPLPNAGYQNREFPLIEQVEQFNADSATSFTMWLAFSPASAQSVDGDGIPSWWRLQYFGHITGSASDNSRGSDDADGDGMTNLQEYLAGTNPKDPNSVFKITRVVANGNNAQVITWNSVPGKAYTVFCCNDLATPSWQPLTNGNVTAVGTSTSCTDAPPNNVAQRFYRVGVTP